MSGVLAAAMNLSVLPLHADENVLIVPSLGGTWEVTSATFNGADSARAKGRHVTFGDGEVTTVDGNPIGRTVTFTLDPKAAPQQIDFDRGGSAKALGIYTVHGDELKICYAESGARRPTKFESPAGDRVFLLTLKRAKD